MFPKLNKSYLQVFLYFLISSFISISISPGSNMNTTKFSEGTYWYKTPESIYPEYEELVELSNKTGANLYDLYKEIR